jgi:hypothetical protein
MNELEKVEQVAPILCERFYEGRKIFQHLAEWEKARWREVAKLVVKRENKRRENERKEESGIAK